MLKKAVLFTLLFFVGAVVGLFAGYQFSSWHRLAQEQRYLDDPEFFKSYDLIARLSLADNRSENRFENPAVNLESRRESLNLILDAAQKGRSEVSDPAVLTLLEVESGIACTRLAMTEEAAGNLAASQTWMQKAQATLRQAGWKDCSEAHLKDVVQALSKRNDCNNPCGNH
jgi:hypothetical protein